MKLFLKIVLIIQYVNCFDDYQSDVSFKIDCGGLISDFQKVYQEESS